MAERRRTTIIRGVEIDEIWDDAPLLYADAIYVVLRPATAQFDRIGLHREHGGYAYMRVYGLGPLADPVEIRRLAACLSRAADIMEEWGKAPQ